MMIFWSMIVDLWSFLLGAKEGPAVGLKLLVMAFIAVLAYYFIFGAVSHALKVFGKKAGLASLAALLPWAITSALLAPIFIAYDIHAGYSVWHVLGLLVVICVFLVFAPLQKLLMTGSYVRHLIAALLAVIMTSMVIYWASTIVSTAGLLKGDSERNKASAHQGSR